MWGLGFKPQYPTTEKKGKGRNGMNQTKISKIPGVQRVHSNQAKLELIVLSGNEIEGTRRAIRARSWRVCIFWEAASFQNPGKALDTEKGGEMWILNIYLALMSSIQNIEGIRKKKKKSPSFQQICRNTPASCAGPDTGDPTVSKTRHPILMALQLGREDRH